MILSFIGLTLAFSFAYVVGVMSKDTLTSDHYLSTSDRLFRVIQSEFQGGWSDTTYGPFAPIINENFDEVETAVRLIRIPIKGSAGEGNEQFGMRATFVDGNFARAFPLALVSGDIAKALSKPRGIVISKATAQRFFGDRDPIGQTITVDLYDTHYDYEVGAVLDVLPNASHLDFEMILPFNIDDVTDFRMVEEVTGYGSRGSIITYLLLRDGIESNAFRKQFWPRLEKLLPTERIGNVDRLDIENVRGLQFWSKPENGTIKAPVDRKALLSVIGTAFLVLVAAISNHMNLTVAATLRRGREVAVRRILGASKKQIIAQLFVETLLLTAFAAWVALDIAPFIAEYVGGYVGQGASLNEGHVIETVALMAIAIFAAVMVAFYPTFWIARTHARDLLAGAQSSVTGGGSHIRVVLVGVQVALGMGLVFATFMINAQVNHVMTVDKGFDYEGKLHIDAANGEIWDVNREAFAREVLNLNGVKGQSFSTNVPFIDSNWKIGFNHPRTNEQVQYEVVYVEPEFFSEYDIQPRAGRLLDNAYGSDTLIVADALKNAQAEGQNAVTLTRSVVLSEAAARSHGFDTNEDAIGGIFQTSVEESFTLNKIIVGIVPDVSFKAGKKLSIPTFYEIDERKGGVGYWYVTFDIEKAAAETVLPQIQAVWQRYFPNDVFNYSHALDNLKEAYAQERLLLDLFAFAGALSLFVTITGIYSLSRFLLVQRTREVAMRKVLGARTRDILELIIKEFSKPVIAGLLIGIPAAAYFLDGWLSLYQVRLDFGFAEAAGFAIAGFIFCLAVVFSEAIRAISIRPAKVLYHE